MLTLLNRRPLSATREDVDRLLDQAGPSPPGWFMEEFACLSDALDGKDTDVHKTLLSLEAVPIDHERKFDDFRVVRLAGKGAMGVVVVAERITNTLPDPRVAIKISQPLKHDPENRCRFKERFLNECRSMALVLDAHVVRIRESMEGPPPYLVMDYIYGPTLDDLLDHHANESVPLELGIDLIRQAALGLTAIHEKGVIHRDVKPANILLKRVPITTEAPCGWWALIGDFGLAIECSVSGLTEPGHFAGTSNYCSPARKQGKPATMADDVYALGLIAHQLLTGRHPKLESNACPLPPVYERIVRDMFDDEPNKRPRAREVVAYLTSHATANDLASHPNAPSTRRRLRRWGMFVAAASVSAAVYFLGGPTPEGGGSPKGDSKGVGGHPSTGNPLPTKKEEPASPALGPVEVERPPIQHEPITRVALDLPYGPDIPPLPKLQVPIDVCSFTVAFSEEGDSAGLLVSKVHRFMIAGANAEPQNVVDVHAAIFRLDGGDRTFTASRIERIDKYSHFNDRALWSASLSPSGERLVTLSPSHTLFSLTQGDGASKNELKSETLWKQPPPAKTPPDDGRMPSRRVDLQDSPLLEYCGYDHASGQVWATSRGATFTHLLDRAARVWKPELPPSDNGRPLSCAVINPGGGLYALSVDGLLRYWAPDGKSGRTPYQSALMGASEPESAIKAPVPRKVGLVVAKGGSRLLAWRHGAGDFVSILKPEGDTYTRTPLSLPPGSILAARFSTDATRLYTVSADVVGHERDFSTFKNTQFIWRCWDVAEGKVAYWRRLEWEKPALFGFAPSQTPVAWNTPDKNHFAITADLTVHRVVLVDERALTPRNANLTTRVEIQTWRDASAGSSK